jgi:hypothetical protein
VSSKEKEPVSVEPPSCDWPQNAPASRCPRRTHGLAVPGAVQPELSTRADEEKASEELAAVVATTTPDPPNRARAIPPRHLAASCTRPVHGCDAVIPGSGRARPCRRVPQALPPAAFGTLRGAATFSTLFFMTLLERTTVESAKHLRRAEFDALPGTGRAPGSQGRSSQSLRTGGPNQNPLKPVQTAVYDVLRHRSPMS